MAHRCPGDRGASRVVDGSPVHRVWDASVCCASLENRNGFDGKCCYVLEFSQWRVSSKFRRSFFCRFRVKILPR
jgi:hypothetical protein